MNSQIFIKVPASKKNMTLTLRQSGPRKCLKDIKEQ